jgi:DNA-binding transcriptional ArsR family regulator
MGVTKSDLFSEKENKIATSAKALAHPARVAILNYLLKSNVCINGDLVSELGLAQPTISQHLRELKDIGLIQGTIEGSSVSYCINHKRWQEVQEIFNNMFDQYADKEGCC